MINLPSLETVLGMQPPREATSGLRYSVGADDESKGLAIILQDQHTHPDVQRHLSRLIAFYSQTLAIPECFVEGASGPGEMATFEELPAGVRSCFGAFLLELGFLTGPELFGLQSPETPCDLWGVDAPGLYRVQHSAAAMLEESGRRLSDIGRTAFRAFAERLDVAPADFTEAAKFVNRLFDVSWEIDATGALDLSALVALAANYPVALAQVMDLPRTLSVKTFLDREWRANAKRITAELEGGVEATALGKVVHEFDEAAARWSQFAWALEDSLALRYGMTGLARLHQFLLLSEKAFGLRLESQFQAFVTNTAADVANGSIQREARRIAEPWGLGSGWVGLVDRLAAAWPLPNTYYYFARRRSSAMAELAARRMHRTGARLALVVSGGFHSSELARHLWTAHRIKSIILTPEGGRPGQEMFYVVRLVAEERGRGFGETLVSLTPSLIRKFGIRAYVRKLWTVARAFVKLKIEGARVSGPRSTGRSAALAAFSEPSPGPRVLVECADVRRWLDDEQLADTIWVDEFTYDVSVSGNRTMLGQRWDWASDGYVKSPVGAVCCHRGWMGLRSSFARQVIWIPRFETIRESERRRALAEMARLLRPDGTLCVWIGGRDLDGRMVNALKLVPHCEVERLGDWLYAKRTGLGSACDHSDHSELSQPIIRVLYAKGSTAVAGEQVADLIGTSRASLVCHRATIDGVHTDVLNQALGLTRPGPASVQELVRVELEAAERDSTLTVLVADGALLELMGGLEGLRAGLRAVDGDGARVCCVVEVAKTLATRLGVRAYTCESIVSAVVNDAVGLTTMISVALDGRRQADMSASMPEMLPGYLACPECDDRPPLAVQTGFAAPKGSSGVLICSTCKTGFRVRNGIPELMPLGQMRGVGDGTLAPG